MPRTPGLYRLIARRGVSPVFYLSPGGPPADPPPADPPPVEPPVDPGATCVVPQGPDVWTPVPPA